MILAQIRIHPGVSRAELARTLHLTKSSVSDAVRSLMRVGLVRDRGRGQISTAGRKPRRLFFSADFGQIIAIDLGGTTLRAAVVDLDGAILSRIQEDVHRQDLDGQLVRVASRMVTDSSAARPLAVGIGVAGTVDRAHGVVLEAPALERSQWNIVETLRSTVPSLPLVLDNDVNLAALGEQWRGAARGHANVVCLSIGTGIGAGLIVDGQLYRGARGLAGEAGYLYQRAEVPNAPFDTFGDLELQAAGAGITRRAAQEAEQAPAAVTGSAAAGSGAAGPVASRPVPARSFSVHGIDSSDGAGGAHQVFLAAEAGDEISAGIIDHAATQIGIAVGNIVSLLDPEMVVLLGGIGLGQAPRLLPAIREVVHRIAPPVARAHVAIVGGELADDAVLIGGACAAQEALGLR